MWLELIDWCCKNIFGALSYCRIEVEDLNTRWKPNESESIVRIKGGEMM